MPSNRKPLVKIKDEVEFYQHQLDGIRTMARMSSFILADEMGLGKSLQALTVAAIDFERGWASRVLIVCPATLKGNWMNEIRTMTHFSAMVVAGTPKERRHQIDQFAENGTDILIVNYEQVVAHQLALDSLGFDIVIYDEGHYFKNPKSKRTKAVLALGGNRHFILTGSPMLNQVNELWALLHRIDPDQFPKYYRFVNRYCTKGGYQGKQIVGVKNRVELQNKIDTVMIRRLKKDCLDLPDKQYITIEVDFHPQQWLLYTQAKDLLEIHRWPGDPDPLEVENALTKALRLKQICGTTFTLIEEDHSYKLDRAVELCQEITHDEPDNPGEHVVVFTQFRAVQEAMKRRLEAVSIPVYTLNGDTPMDTRTEVVQQWGASKQPSVMVAMLQVAGVGLNMTQASKCIFLDKLWVPKLNEQAEDRLHRIGADKVKPIQIYNLVVRKSVERRVEQINRQKTKLFNTLIEQSNWKQAIYQALREEDTDE